VTVALSAERVQLRTVNAADEDVPAATDEGWKTKRVIETPEQADGPAPSRPLADAVPLASQLLITTAPPSTTRTAMLRPVIVHLPIESDVAAPILARAAGSCRAGPMYHAGARGSVMHRFMRWPRAAGAVALCLAVVAGAVISAFPGGADAQSGGTVLPGTQCPAFPADNVWNTPVTGLPVAADSATWLVSMDASSAFLHPDYGPSGKKKKPYGIPWQIVSPSQPLISVRFRYASESDPGPYPLSASTPIEGGSDRHAIMVNPATCTLFELYDTRYHGTKKSKAGSGATWDLNSDALRPAGWTSADAAGLPILPGLVNYDEVSSGTMDHAIRFTAQCTQQAFVWPARHEAGQDDTDCPPMGARFRLTAGFSLPATQCSAMCQTVVTTMKTYGLILADNGSNWYFQGTADARWTDTEVDQLKQIPASAFVAVDESCLMVSANSGQAYQPGTTGYTDSCG